jgi:aldehyde dehydrogenase (NAD+)
MNLQVNNHEAQELDYGVALESDVQAREWLAEHPDGFGLFIDGRWRHAAAGRQLDVQDPSNARVLGRIAVADADDVDAAVVSARQALPRWKRIGAARRSRQLYALGRMLQRHAKLFAVLESLDSGKPLRESRDIDVPLAIRHFLYHAGWAALVPSTFPDHRAVGVAGQIIPWNFPLLMLAWKVAPALAAGCTVVLKPAEQTPLTALLFAELAARTGLTKGVFNLVTGGPDAGAALVNHPGINKIAFTGSTEVGRSIQRALAGTAKRQSLELGGKSPFIVCEDADLDSAVEGLVDGIWFNQGQVCCAGSRVLVQESIAERLESKVRTRMERLRVGKPLDKNIDVGAIVSAEQLARIDRLVQQGISEGAICWQPQAALPTTGYYYPPTLITGLSPANVLAREEVFGPVLSMMSFRTLEDAVALANDTRYGLAATIWSENVNVALHLAAGVRAGVVWINATNLFDASCPFGGYKESGFGREGGPEGLAEYLVPELAPPGKPFRDQVEHASNPSATPTADLANRIDRTAKLYIGGRQVRPESSLSAPLFDRSGRWLGDAGVASTKDVRDAVEAALAARSWRSATAYLRYQVLAFLAENLDQRRDVLARAVASAEKMSTRKAQQEVDLAIERAFRSAAWADKLDGLVHTPPMRGLALSVPEPLGAVGLALGGGSTLLSLLTLAVPLLAMGNSVVVAVPTRYALVASVFCQVLAVSDLPAGTLNLLTGDAAALGIAMAGHAGLDAVWCVGDVSTCRAVDAAGADNLKRLWTSNGRDPEWNDTYYDDSQAWCRRAVQLKTIWVPYGA